VRVSTDGGANWTAVVPEGGYVTQRRDPYINDGTKEDAFAGPEEQWVVAFFDLSTYAGDDIMLRFDFSTDVSIDTYKGWLVDDMIIGDFTMP